MGCNEFFFHVVMTLLSIKLLEQHVMFELDLEGLFSALFRHSIFVIMLSFSQKKCSLVL